MHWTKQCWSGTCALLCIVPPQPNGTTALHLFFSSFPWRNNTVSVGVNHQVTCVLLAELKMKKKEEMDCQCLELNWPGYRGLDTAHSASAASRRWHRKAHRSHTGNAIGPSISDQVHGLDTALSATGASQHYRGIAHRPHTSGCSRRGPTFNILPRWKKRVGVLWNVLV